MAVTKTAPAKKAAAPVKKAAPAKSTPVKSATAPVATADEEPDLLAELGGDEDTASPVDEDDESYNLLDDLTEDDGVAWTPATDEDQPRGIQGRVTHVSTIESDQKYGGGTVPYIQLKSGDGTEWSIRGYHTVLRNQIEKADPQVGDLMAAKYLGLKSNRAKDNDYENYRVAVRK